MSAEETLAAAQAAGVRVGVEGQTLLIEAACAPPEALLAALRRDKAMILRLLRAPTAVEEGAAAAIPGTPDLHGLTLEEVRNAAGEDWQSVEDDAAMLEALARAVVTRHRREGGKRPPEWTELCECDGCGPVFLWPGSPPRVLGCPWCFNRAEERPIPRPVAVTCGTCRHFRRIDHPHLGHCAAGEPEAIAGLWDTDRRGCGRWLPLEQAHGARADG